jgi:hypothetical protein
MKNLLRFSPHRKQIHPRVRKSISEDTRDRPVHMAWRPKEPDALASLELPKPRKRITQLAQAQIISAALVGGREDLERWISYSRARTFYDGLNGRYGDTYSYKLIVPNVDALAEAGWLENDRKPPGHYGEQSRMKAADKLLATLEDVEVVYAPRETILMHGDDPNLLDYQESAEFRRMRREIAAINEGISAYNIELRDIPFREGMWLRNGRATLGAVNLSQYRQFQRGSTECGGRLYGASWQNFPQRTQDRRRAHGRARLRESACPAPLPQGRRAGPHGRPL